MSMPFGPGRPYLQVLDANGTVVKKLYLPPPDKGYGEVEWTKEVYSEWQTLTKENRERVAGFVPKLILKWSVYDDIHGRGLTLGNANGNQARFQDLMEILATPPGRLRVCPGPAEAGGTDVGFICHVKKVPKAKLIGNRFAQNVELELVGRAVQATPILPALT